jgi:hypothetical protein
MKGEQHKYSQEQKYMTLGIKGINANFPHIKKPILKPSPGVYGNEVRTSSK